jgi:hypothetical protein
MPVSHLKKTLSFCNFVEVNLPSAMSVLLGNFHPNVLIMKVSGGSTFNIFIRSFFKEPSLPEIIYK